MVERHARERWKVSWIKEVFEWAEMWYILKILCWDLESCWNLSTPPSGSRWVRFIVKDSFFKVLFPLFNTWDYLSVGVSMLIKKTFIPNLFFQLCIFMGEQMECLKCTVRFDWFLCGIFAIWCGIIVFVRDECKFHFLWESLTVLSSWPSSRQMRWVGLGREVC